MDNTSKVIIMTCVFAIASSVSVAFYKSVVREDFEMYSSEETYDSLGDEDLMQKEVDTSEDITSPSNHLDLEVQYEQVENGVDFESRGDIRSQEEI
jgi:hypothetical protein